MGKRRGKHKRLFPIKFAADYIDVTRPANKEMLASYSAHALTLGGGDLPSVQPNALETREEISTVETLWLSWTSENHANHGVDKFHYIVHDECSQWKLKLFFSGNLYYWVFEDYKRNIARVSVQYVGKDAAIKAWQLDRIQYIRLFTK